MSALLIGLVLAAVQGSGAEAANQGLSFVENRGQWAEHVEFAALWAADGRRGALRAERGRLVLQVDDLERSVREVVAYELEGGETWRPEGRGEVARHHAFLGSDPSKWVRNALAFERIVYLDGRGEERLDVSWSGGDVELRSLGGSVHLRGGATASSLAPSTIAVSGSSSLEAEKGVIWATYFGLSCTFSGSGVTEICVEVGVHGPFRRVLGSRVDARGGDARLRVSTSSAQAPPCARPLYSEFSSASMTSLFAASSSALRGWSWTWLRPGRCLAVGNVARNAARLMTSASGAGAITIWRA